MRAALACLIASSLLTARTARAEQPLSTSAGIDRACDAAEKSAAKHATVGRIFADVAPDEPGAQPIWRSFSSTKALEHAIPDRTPHAQAKVWPAVAGVVFVEIFFTSDSGDWAQFADLCYRPDGTLARAIDTYNTFLAGNDDSEGVSRVHTLHFDTGGKVVSKRSKLLDLQTHRPVKRSFMVDQEDRIFLHVTDLPFSALLSASAQ